MNLIDSYDESEEIVKPEIFTQGQIRLPEIAIVFFKKELEQEVENRYEKYSTTLVLGDEIPLYRTKIDNKEVIIYRTVMGGPATVAIMEELHSRGVNKFIIFGSCGELTSDLEKGAFIIPEQAYRDEGTSYHYVPTSDFIEVKNANKLAEIFDKNNIKYNLTKVWTTDALYRETTQKANNRKNSGCKVVDMECASIMAMAKHRNIDVYQFLYTDDTLEGEEWDVRTFKDDRTIMLKKCLEIAFDIVKKI